MAIGSRGAGGDLVRETLDIASRGSEMSKVLRNTASVVLTAAALLSALSAHATPCTGVSLGTSATGDVTLAGQPSDQCVVSSTNPQQGASGNTSGFASAFGSGWSMLGKVTAASGSSTLGGVGFSWTFSSLNTRSGTWSLTTDQDATFDLVFAMHAANRSDAFLFDDITTDANELNGGTWSIKWLNNGGQVPDFSNLTLFARDIEIAPPKLVGLAGDPVPPSAVPEPGTCMLALAALGALGWTRRRAKV